MRWIRTMLTVGVIFGLASASATADTYYFNQTTEGDWDTQANWWPGDGPPDDDDTAIIVDGYTCLVEDDDQEANVVEVEEGATLGIVGRDLTVALRLQVNGTVYFDGSSPRLLSDGLLKIWRFGGANGLVTARRADGYDPGYILAPQVSISSGITLAGSLLIHPDDVSGAYVLNDGNLVVDGSTDVMEVGEAASGTYRPGLEGSGQITASAGTLRFGRIQLGGSELTAYWSVSDTGTMEVTEFVTYTDYPTAYPAMQFIVHGGTLEIEADLLTRGGLEFQGGTIEVQPGKTAEFLYDPPEEEE